MARIIDVKRVKKVLDFCWDTKVDLHKVEGYMSTFDIIAHDNLLDLFLDINNNFDNHNSQSLQELLLIILKFDISDGEECVIDTVFNNYEEFNRNVVYKDNCFIYLSDDICSEDLKIDEVEEYENYEDYFDNNDYGKLLTDNSKNFINKVIIPDFDRLFLEFIDIKRFIGELDNNSILVFKDIDCFINWFMNDSQKKIKMVDYIQRNPIICYPCYSFTDLVINKAFSDNIRLSETTGYVYYREEGFGKDEY